MERMNATAKQCKCMHRIAYGMYDDGVDDAMRDGWCDDDDLTNAPKEM